MDGEVAVTKKTLFDFFMSDYVIGTFKVSYSGRFVIFNAGVEVNIYETLKHLFIIYPKFQTGYKMC